MYTIPDVLSPTELGELNAAIDALEFVDGKATASGRAREVKNNEQAAPSPDLEKVQRYLLASLSKNALFVEIAQPKSHTNPIISRYGVGKEYGYHVDNAIMSGIRADLSYTLFLRDPQSYDGGELTIRFGTGEQRVKLPAGHLICYPSNTLHRVAPVTRNERVAAVGWVQSYVRENSRREILFDLARVRGLLRAKNAAGPEADLLTKAMQNLKREWSDI